jgi:DME family drug/metabolite transporter
VTSGAGHRPAGLLPYLLVLGAATCWGTIGIAFALLLRDSSINPLTLVFIRALSASAALGLFLLVWKRELLVVRPRDLPFLALLGIVCVSIFYPVLIYAYQLTSVAIGTVLLYLAPAFVTLVSARWFGETLGRRKVLALLLCLTGAILVVEPWRGAALRANALGIALGLLSALAYGAYSLLGKFGLRRHRPPTLLFYMLGFGSLGLLPVQLLGGSAIPTGRTLLLIVLVTGVLITLLPLGLYTVALTHLPAGNAAIVATFEPVVSILLAALILGQYLGPIQIVGAAAIIGGVLVLAGGERRANLAARRREGLRHLTQISEE